MWCTVYEHSSSAGHASTMRTFSLPPLSSSSSCSSSFPLFSFASSVRATLLFDSLITSLSPPPPKLCNASSLANSTWVRCRGALAGGLSLVVLETFSLWNQRIQEWRLTSSCDRLNSAPSWGWLCTQAFSLFPSPHQEWEPRNEASVSMY